MEEGDQVSKQPGGRMKRVTRFRETKGPNRTRYRGTNYLRIGHDLAEVFSVRLEALDYIDGEDSGKLYGTMKFVRRPGFHCFYNRGREDYESIKPGEMFTLTGFSKGISGYDPFEIEFDLRNYDDNEVAISGYILYNAFRDRFKKLNVVQTKKVVGKQGSLIVKHAVLTNAVQANVEVILINNGDGKNPKSAHVYGLVAAQDNRVREEILLFRKSSEEPKEHIEVKPGEKIPLSRSLVIASMKSFLTVRVKLCCEYDGHEIMIADDSVNFIPKVSGTSTQNISGKYGEIQVKVTWVDVDPEC